MLAVAWGNKTDSTEIDNRERGGGPFHARATALGCCGERWIGDRWEGSVESCGAGDPRVSWPLSTDLAVVRKWC